MTVTQHIPYRFPNDWEQGWLDADGREVQLDGHTYVVRSSYRGVWYPVPGYKLDVILVPKEQRSEWYRAKRQEMGDDWFVDLLASDEIVYGQVAVQVLQ